MANIKSLARDTAIYGLSSIVGRFLNYLLVPIYTQKMSVESGEYGVITNVYAYVALLLVILTYGMETTFFRFANKQDENPEKVYSTALWTVGATSLLFVVVTMLNLQPIANLMQYGDQRFHLQDWPRPSPSSPSTHSSAFSSPICATRNDRLNSPR